MSASDSELPLPDKPNRVTVEESGLRSIRAEHTLLFDAVNSLVWLRQCRAVTKVTIHANLPIVAGTSALFEAVLRRCMYEVLYERKRRGVQSADAVRRKIEKSQLYGEQILDILLEVFPPSIHPKSSAYLDGPIAKKARLLFRLRNIAAHGGSVWTETRLPRTVIEKTMNGTFLRENYTPLFDEIGKLGYDLRTADGVDGLTHLFSETPLIDEICSGAFALVAEFLTVLRAESEDDAAAFHNAGILWPQVAQAFTGEMKFL
jgi:hypothetical protein